MENEILHKDANWGMRASETCSVILTTEYPPRLVLVNEPINSEWFGLANLSREEETCGLLIELSLIEKNSLDAGKQIAIRFDINLLQASIEAFREQNIHHPATKPNWHNFPVSNALLACDSARVASLLNSFCLSWWKKICSRNEKWKKRIQLIAVCEVI